MNMSIRLLTMALFALFLNPSSAADALLSSWYTTNSGKYARVYETTTKKNNGNTSTTWTNQPLPVYSDVQVVQSSTSWVYVQYGGLASHVMGPWLNPQGGVFQFWPTNQHGIRRFPRSPAVQSGTKDSTSGGYSGLFVNGVAIFNALDGQAWDGSQIQGQAPHTQSTYYWHRNAPVAESFNFDDALGHQPPSGIYHTHQNPIGLRYQLGDHVDYNSSTKAYSESAAAVSVHSPIIGWAHDGYPVYGPYGYSTATDTNSGVRRMVSGYVKRDGSNGTDSLNSNRSIIPAWYARYRQNHFGGGYSTTASASRPNTNTFANGSYTYPLGTFAQDWEYLGDLGKTQGTDFDLDEYNGRFCKTPEYPSGTYVYFAAIDSSGASTYPYVFAFEFYGNATGGSVSSISESVSTNYVGGPNTALAMQTPSVNVNNSTVTLVWSSVEGGTYQVESSTNQSVWTATLASVPSQGLTTTTNFTGTNGTAYARVTRTALASYDSATTGTFTSTQTDTESYSLTTLSIDTQPQSQTADPGTNVTFTVVASGITPFSYQWRFNGTNLVGATSSGYTVNSVTTNHAGNYQVVVTNSSGSITSSIAVLTVNGDPNITTQPSSQTITEGNSATFSVVATGTAPLTYQWRFNGTNLSGATSSSYTVNTAATNNAGPYSVLVTSGAGSLLSSNATLTVNATNTGSYGGDVQVTGWFTTSSGRYARLYETTAAQTAGTTVTTWSRGAGVQTLPAYAGIQEISYSTDWVYIRTTGLGFHNMGPWYLDSNKTQLFPNYPANTKTLWRFPRNPAAATSSTLTSLGAIGYFVDGVAMFDGQDGYYWNGTAEAQSGSGGLWNRDAFPEEGVSFDPGNAHQEQTGTYHYHANPLALRYLLGDNVSYNATTKVWTETAGTPTKHSPLIGWVRDGYPIYGPYGYSSALDSSSGIRRMTTGYALRDGQSNTVNLASTGRHTLPAWAARARSRSATLSAGEYGPNVTGIYTVGRYHEDYEYLGDVGYTQGTHFDLDEHNGRFCKTPEYPNGTYAYFMTINSSGTPVYPYNIGRVFYGNATGGAVTSISESVTTNYLGGANATLKLATPTVSGTTVTLTWSATEGGTYTVEKTTNVTAAGWTTKASGLSPTQNTGTAIFSDTDSLGFYRVARTALANYDSGSTGGGGGGGTVTFNATFATTPPLPPQGAIQAAAVGGVTATITSYNQTSGAVSLQFDNSSLAAGNYSATISFTPPGQSQQTLTSSNQYTKN
jgi:hypothetical protein